MESIKQRLQEMVTAGLISLQTEREFDKSFLGDLTSTPLVERPRQKPGSKRDPKLGDYATNIALVLAKPLGQKPRDLAQALVEKLPDYDFIEKIEIAGPGFINFFITHAAMYELINEIREQKDTYGTSTIGAGEKVMVEFVSANPTGPLHVGHGRGAAYGDALARLLKTAGYDAYSEYYVNDAGRQMDILALSTWLRYLLLSGQTLDYPGNVYQGSYVIEMAKKLFEQVGENLIRSPNLIFSNLSEDAETRLDEMIARAKESLGDDYKSVFDLSLNTQLEDMRDDLAAFGVVYDNWFSERSLLDGGAIRHAVDVLKQNDKLYEKGGAWWFKSTEYGDEKDRVVMRANGAHTYFAADIAYHLNKAERGFDKLVNIWGADHHGYIVRVQSAMQAMGLPKDKLIVLTVQFANLIEGGKKISMSTRSGEFVSLRDLRDEVGKDAARFFYTLRKTEQHMDFDLDLARSQSNDNPVYYVQYAHARICSVFRQLSEKKIKIDWQTIDYSLLTESHELDLLRELSRFPEVVESAAIAYEPHQVAYYLRNLANSFHTYYNAHPFIAAEQSLRDARLGLIDAARQVIANGLNLLGVSAPESM